MGDFTDEVKSALVARLGGSDEINGKSLYCVCYRGSFYIIIAKDFYIDMVDGERVLLFTKARRVRNQYNKTTRDFDTDIQEEVHLLMWRMADVTKMYQVL